MLVRQPFYSRDILKKRREFPTSNHHDILGGAHLLDNTESYLERLLDGEAYGCLTSRST